MRVFRSSEYLQRGAGFHRQLDNVQMYPYDQYYNRGDGIGSIFRSLYSTVVPIVKSAFRIGKKAMATPVGQAVKKAAKRTAMSAGLNVVNSALDGERVDKAIKRELKSTPGNFVKELRKNVRGGNAAYIAVAQPSKKGKTVKKKKKKKGGKKNKKIKVKGASLAKFLKQLKQHGSKHGSIKKKHSKHVKKNTKKRKQKQKQKLMRTKADLFDI